MSTMPAYASLNTTLFLFIQRLLKQSGPHPLHAFGTRLPTCKRQLHLLLDCVTRAGHFRHCEHSGSL